MKLCKIPSNYVKDCSKISDIMCIKASVLQDKETKFGLKHI